MAVVVDGRKIQGEILSEVRKGLDLLDERPLLGVVLSYPDEGTRIYVKQIEKAAGRAGIGLLTADIKGDVNGITSVAERADGVLLCHPLGKIPLKEAIYRVPRHKDVEGIHPSNAGMLLTDPLVVPPTPGAVMEILRRHRVRLKGRNVVIVNHSPIVGKPLALLLLREDATVTVCHVHTKNLRDHTSRADILIVGAGVPDLIRREMVMEGVVAIDVGMNRVDGKVVGDLSPDVEDVASLITPVPGGVGPVTVAILMRNLLLLRRERYDKPESQGCLQ